MKLGDKVVNVNIGDGNVVQLDDDTETWALLGIKTLIVPFNQWFNVPFVDEPRSFFLEWI